VGNIKKDEKVILISNHCRGIDVNVDRSNKKLNIVSSLKGQEKEDLEVIRELSKTKMYNRL